MQDLFAVFVDGGYFRMMFRQLTKDEEPPKGRYPQPVDVKNWCDKYKDNSYFKGSTLYRIFYYDSLPPSPNSQEAGKTHLNPFTGQREPDFSQDFLTATHRFWNELSEMPFFAMRKGTLTNTGFEVSSKNFKSVMEKIKKKQPLENGDLLRRPKQKQVDMKIGMDIAHVCIKRLVSKILLVAGDSDIAPAAKLARVEGVQVFLDTMGHQNMRAEFLNHVDVKIG